MRLRSIFVIFRRSNDIPAVSAIRTKPTCTNHSAHPLAEADICVSELDVNTHVNIASAVPIADDDPPGDDFRVSDGY